MSLERTGFSLRVHPTRESGRAAVWPVSSTRGRLPHEWDWRRASGHTTRNTLAVSCLRLDAPLRITVNLTLPLRLGKRMTLAATANTGAAHLPPCNARVGARGLTSFSWLVPVRALAGSTVGCRELVWSWALEDDGACRALGNTTIVVVSTLGSPLPPWKRQIQNRREFWPWSDLMETAGRLGAGAKDANTLLRALATSIFALGGQVVECDCPPDECTCEPLRYDPNDPATTLSGGLLLPAMLSFVNLRPGISAFSCNDVAHATAVLANALGIDSRIGTFTLTSGEVFTTRRLIASGHRRAKRQSLTQHIVATTGGLTADVWRIWDGSYQLPVQSSVSGAHQPRSLPLGLRTTPYLRRLVDSGVDLQPSNAARVKLNGPGTPYPTQSDEQKRWWLYVLDLLGQAPISPRTHDWENFARLRALLRTSAYHVEDREPIGDVIFRSILARRRRRHGDDLIRLYWAPTRSAAAELVLRIATRTDAKPEVARGGDLCLYWPDRRRALLLRSRVVLRVDPQGASPIDVLPTIRQLDRRYLR